MNTSTSSSKKGAAPTSRSSSSKPAGKTFSIGSLTRAFSVTTTLENVPFLPSPIIIKSRAVTMFASPVGLKLAAVAKAATKKPAVQRKRRTAWTPQEDRQLLFVLGKVEPVGVAITSINVKWAEIAKELNTGRNGKQCRDRFQNYLRPGIKKGAWTRDEEELIKDMHRTFGPKWCAMSKLLNNRTDNDIKNKWYSMERKNKRENELRLQQARQEALVQQVVAPKPPPRIFAVAAAPLAAALAAGQMQFPPSTANKPSVSKAAPATSIKQTQNTEPKAVSPTDDMAMNVASV